MTEQEEHAAKGFTYLVIAFVVGFLVGLMF